MTLCICQNLQNYTTQIINSNAKYELQLIIMYQYIVYQYGLSIIANVLSAKLIKNMQKYTEYKWIFTKQIL